ncbi:MAG TPA: alpha/beta hydrolase [Nevskiaceae bacterium]|nr:alpha/beta hydrolase [Nevskiaceae bacterium]
MASLDPQAQAMLQAMAALPPMDYTTDDPTAYRQMASGPSMFAPGDAVARIENREIPGPGGVLAIRVYVPRTDPGKPLPVTVYFHGGGFVACNLDTHDNVCRCLAQRARCIVVSVDYRLAPETPFPGPVEDALAALNWVHDHAAELGGDASRIAVAGDSAGGNLAAVAALQSRGTAAAPCHQLLLYPVTDCHSDTASYHAFGQGYFLTAEMMQWFHRLYLPEPAMANDPRASPLKAKDLAGVAPATIFTGEYDPLRDEGEAYAHALAAAGVSTTLRRWPGQIHGFASMLGAIPAADAAMSAGARALRIAFSAL